VRETHRMEKVKPFVGLGLICRAHCPTL